MLSCISREMSGKPIGVMGFEIAEEVVFHFMVCSSYSVGGKRDNKGSKILASVTISVIA